MHGKPKLKEPQLFRELWAPISDNPLDVLNVSFLPFAHLKATMVQMELISSAPDARAHSLILLLLVFLIHIPPPVSVDGAPSHPTTQSWEPPDSSLNLVPCIHPGPQGLPLAGSHCHSSFSLLSTSANPHHQSCVISGSLTRWSRLRSLDGG